MQHHVAKTTPLVVVTPYILYTYPIYYRVIYILLLYPTAITALKKEAAQTSLKIRSAVLVLTELRRKIESFPVGLSFCTFSPNWSVIL